MDAAAIELVLERALARDAAAMHQLVGLLAPPVQYEISCCLRGRVSGRRNVQQELEDLVQEVFAFLFADNARALRAWRKDGGRSLINFVRLLARHQVASVLRSAKRNPWTDEPMSPESVAIAAGATESFEAQLESRELLGSLLDRLLPELTPRGMQLFQILYVEQQPVDAACSETGMSKDAVYAWRTRVKRLIARLAKEMQGQSAIEERR